ncbi:uncharacterized protein LOC106477113 [Limulus polyphemus]|uniref:Uncharacterized protein LOC106477113 n=1 Tax=Limulus polyphemus TaxID=6850 RepID=A0ABM1RYP9_LIMPO|nr:uncharacterized protein LOC106477113 [Limulus polyphemus]
MNILTVVFVLAFSRMAFSAWEDDVEIVQIAVIGSICDVVTGNPENVEATLKCVLDELIVAYHEVEKTIGLLKDCRQSVYPYTSELDFYQEVCKTENEAVQLKLSQCYLNIPYLSHAEELIGTGMRIVNTC